MPAQTRHPDAAPKRDSLGCSLSKLDRDQTVASRNITFHHKSSLQGAPGQVTMPATDRGFLIGLSTQAGHRRRIFREHHAEQYDFEANGVYVRPFSDSYKADLGGTFDFILAEVTYPGLSRIADEADAARVTELRQTDLGKDDVLGGLLGALFSSSIGPMDRSALFVDQLSVAIGIHLLSRYGNGPVATPGHRRMFSSRQKALVQDMLQANMSGDVSVADLAEACGMAPAAFMQAFRDTFGQTPHQFLTQLRIARACDLLMAPSMSLKDVALKCGFSDQSHFTRGFAKATGTTPGAWRRERIS
ncbi:Exoenzyme S synthesis regulatory protein ExsA [Hartmannibacter diazotrophicus]|uniref:Exoenzyme S synthesis regulatory protein ExsA n=1 Tax=Hartmannibacter diazotrophicus TaxID=1482074 RepID=A0A2C9D174_9HYPH|nr:AraC family transcriptional regulator [Hartmannibacter diazotrophicus]SON54000.1 Exoenzyme S synthesis regulatory protein ExsA [Hartmannibacter diazotrophicus]